MKKTNYIFLGVGIIILILLLKTFGIEATLIHLKQMGWKFMIIIAICLLNNIFLTLGWRVLITQHLSAGKYFKFLLARIAGDSTSSINAIGAVAGEPLKAMYLRDTVPFRTGLASVVLDRTIHTVGNIFVVLTGIIVSFFVLNLPLYITGLTLSGVLAFLIVMIIVVKKQKDGFVEFILGKLPDRLVKSFMNESRWDKARTLDREISEVFSSRDNMNHFYISLSLHYLSTLITQSLEIYCIVIFIQPGISFGFIDGVFVYIFGFILTSAVFFMPANVGTSEGSYSLALGFLGFDPVIGLSVGIIRRFRSFVWSGIGILILFYAGLLKKDNEAVAADERPSE